ncbi:lipopolysaccharide biosynthesis protein [Dyadobacter sp. CY323]|uniref:lipopolysaccharide biosynthesis protein n=1 Tax=Dyadobacter sp. CY323 TaxID=2907302 RepID=UPI001F18F07A|nr:hypothetical protein [Dyadobacter sp. CY323]MCE6992757.1 hypothetical protein [Dyadobacter sp. CY323]
MSNKYIVDSFLWGVVAKVFDALVKFISVPLLLSYFGKNEFGLIALASSINAYLQLLDMGINTGSIKHFSEWIAAKKYDLLDSTARTSITFYGIIGIINALVLIIIALWGMSIFSITPDQAETLRVLFFILSIFAIVNWSTSVYNQLLIANHNIKYVRQLGLVKTVANLVVIYFTIWLKLNITLYFFLFCIANSFIVIPNFLKAKSSGLISGFLPKKDWANFQVVFKYSMAIIAMGIFQMSATKLRPVVLGIFSNNVSEVLAEYRIMETITIFIISIGGMFVTILLPVTSKLLTEKNQEKIEEFAYGNTLFTTIICVFLCMPFVVAGREILHLYVGSEYVHLYNWLTIWVLTILFSLHNSPIASLVLSTGKTKMLIISSAISCVISVVLNVMLCKYFEVGSAIIGYAVYIVIQMSFYYFYFNGAILKLNSWKVFKSFIYPAAMGILIAVGIITIDINTGVIIIDIAAKLSLWATLYTAGLFTTKLIEISNVRRILNRKNVNN